MIWPRWTRTGTIVCVAIVVARVHDDGDRSCATRSDTAPTSTVPPRRRRHRPRLHRRPRRRHRRRRSRPRRRRRSRRRSPPVTDTSAPSTTTPATTTPAPPDTNGSVSAQAVPAGAADEVFARGTDGALWWRQLATNGWSLWQSFGGGVVGTPAAVGRERRRRLGLRARHGQRRCTAGATTAPPGPAGTASAAISRAIPWSWPNATGVYVFARGGDGALYWGKFTTGGSWSGYRRLGGALSGDRPSPKTRAACTCSSWAPTARYGCSDSSMTSLEASSGLGRGVSSD